MYLDTADLVAMHFDLASVETGSDFSSPSPRSPSRIATAQRMARPGPSKVARTPSPVFLTRCPHRGCVAEISTMVDPDVAITGAMQHQGRNVDRRQQVPHVQREHGLVQRSGSGRTRRLPLQSASATPARTDPQRDRRRQQADRSSGPIVGKGRIPETSINLRRDANGIVVETGSNERKCSARPIRSSAVDARQRTSSPTDHPRSYRRQLPAASPRHLTRRSGRQRAPQALAPPRGTGSDRPTPRLL